ncbi:olfactory receptor 5I1-like [Rhinatrema bivittatum]|uniref:olfactory receptor 5I1-like n=1 Tax=Rhinatrema bivittatum TaxID=194408 RepID=UPI00112C6BE9|nr:olfactory receptor 5I1-like [Rhinatrema bivittatum]
MANVNISMNEFLLLGFSDVPHLQSLLFVMFLMLYLIAFLGNLSIILVIWKDPHLHTPMYFFLRNLSIIDFCYSSDIAPQALVNFLSERKNISYLGCAAQFYFFVALGGTESFLLAVMAYDRYVAICNPLLYSVVMTKRLCILLLVASYLGGFINSFIQTVCAFQLSFCRSNEINHFFCDIPPLMKLSCTDTFINEILLSTLAGSVTLSSILVILLSYTYILSAILKIRSAEGRYKAFSTCASHFVCVTLFYGTVLFMYMRPKSSYSLNQDRVVAVIYTLVIPMLNPLIYSLRNQEVKRAMRKMKKKREQCKATEPKTCRIQF